MFENCKVPSALQIRITLTALNSNSFLKRSKANYSTIISTLNLFFTESLQKRCNFTSLNEVVHKVKVSDSKTYAASFV